MITIAYRRSKGILYYSKRVNAVILDAISKAYQRFLNSLQLFKNRDVPNSDGVVPRSGIFVRSSLTG